MNLNEFAKEIHENAVAHGWWPPEGRTDAEVLSLVHSEWSEALEAYRNNEPMRWYTCTMEQEEAKCEQRLCPFPNKGNPTGYWSGGCCEAMKAKPEGVAVELIDGCIRLLDAVVAWGMKLPEGEFHRMDHIRETVEGFSLPQLVMMLHWRTTEVWKNEPKDYPEQAVWDIVDIIHMVQIWLKKREVDFDTVIQEKNEYNKTRPYRHGGKKI